MFKRWASYQDVGSFGSMLQSFASMTDVIMLSNWPMFMDAAGVVGNTMLANIFFFSFKGLTFYFVMPVMLGFIVQSYMAAKLPGQESNEPLAPVRSNSPQGPGESEDGGGAAAASGGPVSGSRFRYTKLADDHYEVDIDEESDNMTKTMKVIVTRKTRSMSMTFWGREQAKQESANLEGNLTRPQDNKSLQALVEKLEIQNRKLLEEAQKQAPKELTWSPLRAPAPETAGSGNSSIAMEATVEAKIK